MANQISFIVGKHRELCRTSAHPVCKPGLPRKVFGRVMQRLGGLGRLSILPSISTNRFRPKPLGQNVGSFWCMWAAPSFPQVVVHLARIVT